ncbi:hypothetical protein [Falsiruegeria mediterranea]|uniref:hypothetical protein n=1 Tax=Falsiruegeria mediterranea TaxID=1280832 RepID=UPI0015F2678A|nr:hypothetical protein [Falsiruegeria mediterranea]
MSRDRCIGIFEETVSKLSCYSACLLALTWFSVEVVLPLQRWLLPSLSPYAIMVYLPFGLIVVVSYLESWKAFVYFLPGAIFVHHVYVDPVFSIFECVSVILVEYNLPILVFVVLDWVLVCDRQSTIESTRSWRILCLGGLLSATGVSIIVHSIERQRIEFDAPSLEVAVQYLIGDFVGFVAFLAFATLCFRLPAKIGRL